MGTVNDSEGFLADLCECTSLRLVTAVNTEQSGWQCTAKVDDNTERIYKSVMVQLYM